MRYSRSKLFMLNLVMSLLFVFPLLGQPSGGDIGFFNSIEVNESLYNYGFHRQIYSGNGDAFRVNHAGAGGLLFDFQVAGNSVFIGNRAGNINHLGPFTTYMLGLRDTDRSHALVMKWNEDDSADRVFNILVGGADAALTVLGTGAKVNQDTTIGSTPSFGIGTGGLTSYDLKVGDTETPSYGMIQIGNSVIGRTSFKGGNVDADGTFVIRNLGGPVTGKIEFIFSESAGNTTRFALPKSGPGYATYNPRSFLAIGPAPTNTDYVDVNYWQGLGWFDNIDCDTSLTGADMGIQDDLEVEGDIYTDSMKESTPGAGVTFDSLIIPSGATPAPDIVGAIFLDTDESVNGSLVVYSNGAWRKVADLP